MPIRAPIVEDFFRNAVNQAMSELGHATILIAGRSGAGKSTLINAVFAGQLAETGQGRPVTRAAREYTKPPVPISLIDSKGLELDAYRETVEDLRRLLIERAADPDAGRHVHCAWICVVESSGRVEEGESTLAAMIASMGIPVIGVVTKHVSDGGMRAKVQELLPRARHVVSVRALPQTLDGTDVVLPPKGLDELVELTMELVPEGQRTAIAAAQKVSFAAKKRRARVAIAAAVTAAMTAAGTPLPIPDAMAIVPIQVLMLAKISVTFGLTIDRVFLATLVAGVLGGGGAALGGRALAGALLKLVPGASVINAAVAGALTTALGEAYVGVLTRLLMTRAAAEITPELLGAELQASLATSRKQS